MVIRSGLACDAPPAAKTSGESVCFSTISISRVLLPWVSPMVLSALKRKIAEQFLVSRDGQPYGTQHEPHGGHQDGQPNGAEHGHDNGQSNGAQHGSQDGKQYGF